MPSELLESTYVVTVTYNSSGDIAGFLESVARSEADPVKVVVVDNASADVVHTRAVCESHGAIFVALNDNRGYGGAVNAAVETLPDSVTSVLVSNPDARIHRGAISTLVLALQDNAGCGAVGPLILNDDGSRYPSARNLPSLRTGVGHALFARIWPTNPWSRSYHAENENPLEDRFVGWLSGSCVLVRRAAFQQIGGFDEGFFMYFEDVDLGYRLGKSGWTNLYHPAAVITHSGAHSTSGESIRMLQAHHDSAYRYLGRKYSAPYLAPLRGILKLSLDVRACYLTKRATKTTTG